MQELLVEASIEECLDSNGNLLDTFALRKDNRNDLFNEIISEGILLNKDLSPKLLVLPLN